MTSLIFVLLIIAIIIVVVVKVIKKKDQEEFKTIENHLKFCPYCGAEVHSKAVVCVKCGCAVYHGQDIPSAGLNVLGFFFPLVGLILFCVYKQNAPRKANAVGRCALGGFILSMSIFFIYLIVILNP